jgi:hypothetical protein
MINVPVSLQSLLQSSSVETFVVVKIGDLKFTSAYFPITVEGELYDPDQETMRLINVDPPAISSNVDRVSYSITVSDPDMTIGQYIENMNDAGLITHTQRGYSGLPVEVRLGFFNPQPLPETLLIYKGMIDTGAYAISLDEFGESIFSFVCSSPMASLDMSRTLNTTKQELRAIAPNDSAFDQVYEGSGQIRILWGKG